MNVYVISADRRLLRAMRESGHYTSVVSISREMVPILLEETEGRARGEREMSGTKESAPREQSLVLHELSSEPDVWLISDRQLDIQETIALRGCCPSSRIVYMLSNGLDPQAMKTRQSLCAAHGIDYTLPYHTAEQVAEAAAGIGIGREKGLSKVITGIAPLPQLGLTSSLLRIGVMLSRMSGIRVGILGLNGWNPGDSGMAYKGKYVDELWGVLQGRQLSASELPAKMHMLAPGVHYLAGSRDLKKLYYYNTEGVSWLIDQAKECFDLILLDAGSYPDHALAAQSILAADLLLVQMHQRQQAKLQWQRMCEHILQPVFRWEERQSLLLFNQMQRSPEMENEKQLSRQVGLSYIGSLPHIPSFSRAETEGRLIEQAWPEYDKELSKVCRALLHFYGIPQLPEPTVSLEGKAAEKDGAARGASWLRWMKPVKGA